MTQAGARYMEVVGSVPAIIWWGNATTFRIPLVSKQVERIMGCRREDWLDDPNFWKNHLHPDDRERVLHAQVTGIEQHVPYEMEYRLLASGGHIVWLRDTVDIAADEAFGITVNITHRSQVHRTAHGDKDHSNATSSSMISDTVLAEMPGLFLLFDQQGHLVRWNKNAEQITEYSADEIAAMNIVDFHMPEGKHIVEEMIARVFKDGHADAEVDLRTKRGDLKPFYLTGASMTNESSSSKRYCIEVGIDIKDRKWIERERADLSARLISAHDEERSRIARELHDDVGQKIALLSVELDQLTQRRARLKEQLRSRLQHAKDSTMELAATIHNLSHQLHPSMLSRLGLRTAILRLCREMRERGLDVTLTYDNVADSLSDDVSLCLFRVAQESLSNVLKHSGVKAAQLEIVGDHDWVRMRVIDTGHGFHPKSKGPAGLGLLSMKERVLLVGGEFFVRQRREGGTEVKVLVSSRAHPVARSA